MIDSFDPIVCTFSLSGTIYIVDEYSLEDRSQSASDEMMHDSITKMRSKYLSLHRISYDKCCTRFECITSIIYLIPEIYTLSFIVELKLECTECISLVLSTIIVRSEDVGEGKHSARNIGFFAEQEQCRCTIIGDSVIVDISIVTIESESIESISIRSRCHQFRCSTYIDDLSIIRIEHTN